MRIVSPEGHLALDLGSDGYYIHCHPRGHLLCPGAHLGRGERLSSAHQAIDNQKSLEVIFLNQRQEPIFLEAAGISESARLMLVPARETRIRAGSSDLRVTFLC